METIKFLTYFIGLLIISIIAYAILVNFLSIFPKWIGGFISVIILLIGWKMASKIK
jgi:hypothetical protein